MPAKLVERLGADKRLDAIAGPIVERIRPPFDHHLVKKTLSGAWLGHRLHPMLTDAVIGFWASAQMLDWWGDERTDASADRLVAAGLASAVPTALTGVSEWTDVYGRGRRVALVHAAANVVAVVLHAASMADRMRGRRERGRWLAFLGTGVLGLGSYLGGHLSYVQGVGVAHTAFNEGPSEWTPVLDEAALPLGEHRTVRAGEREVLLVRRRDGVHALDGRCSHAGWPLGDGSLSADDGEPAGCITCPYHGSVYSTADGSVVAGPAASPQPVLQTRVSNGRIEVREG